MISIVGLREAKKLRTLEAIHKAALRLFAERGYEETTIADIAAAADVSRATFFSYYPSKEDVVFGNAPAAIEALAAALTAPAADGDPLDDVRQWLGTLAGWLEADVVQQLQLAREVPAVGAKRLAMYHLVERVIADALAERLPAVSPQAAGLAAGSLIAGIRTAEEVVGAHVERTGRVPSQKAIDRLLDDAVAFARAGLRELGRGAKPRRRSASR